MQEQQFYAMN